MSWPKRGSGSVTGRCTISATCALLAYLIAAPLAGALADPLFGPPWKKPATTENYGPEQRAEELYGDGMEKLDAGHTDIARELLESVIARYPDSKAAELSRRQLAEIYSAKYTEPLTAQTDTTASIEPPTTAPETAPPMPTISLRTAAWEQEIRRNAAIQTKLRLDAGDRVFFSSGSAELGGRARLALSAQARWLLHRHELEAAIEGHADEPGSDEDNVVLSQRRAEAVRQRLIEEGVEAQRLAVVPAGRSMRLATCSDSDCRAQNRRAVTLVFAGGTRERLGLLDRSSRRAVLQQENATLQVRPEAPPVGVPR